MRFSRWAMGAAFAAALTAPACATQFKLSRYTTNDSLYAAARREFAAHHWENAVAAFEKLTLELPPRDTLLPRSHFFLAEAHAHRDEHLLAAQSYARLAESFPDDTLADDALFEAGREYERMWRRPSLDAQYGQTAATTFRTMMELYPDSPLVPKAQAQLGHLDEWFAQKDFENGMHYLRRKAYDSAIIYFKDVVRLYPNTAHARDSYLRLVQAYRAIRYKEDVAEACTVLRQRYPTDRQVRSSCTGVPTDTAASRDSRARRDTARTPPF